MATSYASVMIPDEEEQEIFLDSFEYLSNASDSASAADRSLSEISEREFALSDYQVWIDDLRSIRERRSKFLRRMHLDDAATVSPEEQIPSFEQDIAKESCDLGFNSLSIEDRGEKCLPIEISERNESRRVIIWEENEKNNPRSRWNCFSATGRTLAELCKCKALGISKVEKQCKGEKKFSSMFMAQEFTGHKGFISSLKFSPDGRYLATGGDDCAVKIWQAVEEEDKECEPLEDSRNFVLAERPLHELHGHVGGVLDLSWSESNYLLSSSKDKTVRLWRVGEDHCLQVFQHSNYVTSVEFNPVDESQFISGSIDGKIRVWGISEARVIDWVHFGDIITSVRYRPDGQGFVAGSLSGLCRFYSSGEILQLNKEVRLGGRKKFARKSITGIQFFPCDPAKILITSSDGNLRFYDRESEVMDKYRVPGRSKSQCSASFTSDGRFIVSVGEDSSVCLWDPSGEKSALTSQCFFSEAASLATTWPGNQRSKVRLSFGPPANVQDAERFSLGTWFFFADVSSKISATWPEENPSPCEMRIGRKDIVTGGHDGVIRTFRNYEPLDSILIHRCLPSKYSRVRQILPEKLARVMFLEREKDCKIIL